MRLENSTLPLLSVLLLAAVLFTATAVVQAEDPFLEPGLEAGRWLRSQGIIRTKTTVWPANADEPQTVTEDLYHGVAGVVLYYLDSYRITGRAADLHLARRGARHLLERLPPSPGKADLGLYTGVAGIGFVLQEAFRATGDEIFRRGTRTCVELLASGSREVGRGAEWNDSLDIISGTAGIGLFLLYATRELYGEDGSDIPAPLLLADQAGDRLMELALPQGDGLKWRVTQDSKLMMPNFSHGTAGVAYYLACLYEATRNKACLDAARAGARYLISVAETEGGRCLVPHHEPGGEDLYYLGWCHGPAGTARLFYKLWKITGDDKWLEWFEKSARAILESGIPEKQTPGFWNNVGYCCGSAGVADFFLDAHRATGKAKYLDFSHQVARDLIARATSSKAGLSWHQAEHRTKPELLKTQTGLMQGAAGIGRVLLHLHHQARKGETGIVMPDSPFPRGPIQH